MYDTMYVEHQPRKCSSSLACLSGVASINLTSSCAHSCIYCYSCSYSSRPSEGTVIVYSNLFEKLKSELARKRKIPKKICSHLVEAGWINPPVTSTIAYLFNIARGTTSVEKYVAGP